MQRNPIGMAAACGGALILTLGLLGCAASLANAAEVIETGTKAQVTYLDAGTIIDFRPVSRHRGFFERDMRIYCYRGARKTLARYFESVELQLDIEGDDYTQYEGATPTEVREHYDERRSFFSFNLFTTKRTRLHLSPFTPQCIGIETVSTYRVRLQQLRVDYWRVVELLLGMCLFLYAGQLSHNALFYYLTGVSLGICLSFMLVIWLSSKLMPRRPLMYGMLLGGWTIGLYMVQKLWDNLQIIFQVYRVYVIWYVLITGLLSFFFCYRYGPPKNQRSKNIIKWVLQLMALGLVYISSYYEEASITIGIITIVLHYFPRSFWQKTRAFYRHLFPPRRRLLTCEEYYEQGVKETSRALEELRHYANSPYCKQWKVISKLRDPQRFASFVEGDSHVCADELAEYEHSRQAEDELDETDISLDEDEELFDDEVEETASHSYRKNNSRQQLQHTPQQQQPLPRRRNIVYEEMSEEDDEDDDDDHEDNHDNNSNDIKFNTANISAQKLQQRDSPLALNNSSSFSRQYHAGKVLRSYIPAPRSATMRQQQVKQEHLKQEQLHQQQQRGSASRSSALRTSASRVSQPRLSRSAHASPVTPHNSFTSIGNRSNIYTRQPLGGNAHRSYDGMAPEYESDEY